MQIHQNTMPQQTIWLYQATAEESVGRSLRERVQVYSSSVPLVLQESTQQRGIQLKFTTILQLLILSQYLQHHIKQECGHVVVSCPNGCGEKLPRKDVRL